MVTFLLTSGFGHKLSPRAFQNHHEAGPRRYVYLPPVRSHIPTDTTFSPPLGRDKLDTFGDRRMSGGKFLRPCH